MQRKVCFEITEEQQKKVKALPRSFNLSDKMRNALDTILEGFKGE